MKSTRTRNETTLNVKSNKTVIGMGDGVTLIRNLDTRDVKT